MTRNADSNDAVGVDSTSLGQTESTPVQPIGRSLFGATPEAGMVHTIAQPPKNDRFDWFHAIAYAHILISDVPLHYTNIMF